MQAEVDCQEVIIVPPIKLITFTSIAGLRDYHRSPAAGGTQHGPGGVRAGRRPEEVHFCQGVHQLSLL